MTETIGQVGFIGLGKMGKAICGRILHAGFTVKVYNRTAAKMQPLLDAGATAAGSPREAASGVDVVLTCLMDDQSVFDVVNGEHGLLAGLRPGGVHIGLATILPTTSVKLAQMHAERGCIYIAGPVAGRPDMVAGGTARTLIAGDQAAIERCRPIVEAYAPHVVNLGPNHAAASAFKILNNYITASQVALMGEVYAFAEKSGLDLDLVVQHFQTLYAAPVLKMYAAKIRERDFDPSGFDLVAGLKDLLLFQQAFADARVVPGFGNVVKDKLLAGAAAGMGKRDWSSTYEITRLLAGLDARLAPEAPAAPSSP